MRVPEPACRGMAVAKAPSRYGCTWGTLPITSTSCEASACTCRGGLRPTITSRAPGRSARQRGQISFARSSAASALGRQSREPTKTTSRRCATSGAESGGMAFGTTRTRRAPISRKACASFSEQVRTRSRLRASSRSSSRMRPACQRRPLRCQRGADSASRSTISASTLCASSTSRACGCSLRICGQLSAVCGWSKWTKSNFSVSSRFFSTEGNQP